MTMPKKRTKRSIDEGMRPNRKNSTGERYIHPTRQGTFSVIIWAKNNRRSYGGIHQTLEKSIEARDKLLESI